MLNRINIRITVVVFVLAGISGYTCYEFRNLFRGPIIVIESPKSGATFQSPVTEIKGSAHNMMHISMNDRDISVDENGTFNEKFALSKGSNIVKVSAKDKFGRHQDVFVEVLYNGPSETLTQR